MKMIKEADFRKLQRLVHDLSQLRCRHKSSNDQLEQQIEELIPADVRREFFLEDLDAVSNPKPNLTLVN